jgi:hypothetical protein
MEEMFSVQSVLGLYNEGYAVVRNEKLVAEAWNSSGTERKGSICCWKQIPGNG